MYWASSGSWAFALLPAAPSQPNVVQALNSMTSFFTGEYDSVLMPGEGKE